MAHSVHRFSKSTMPFTYVFRNSAVSFLPPRSMGRGTGASSFATQHATTPSSSIPASSSGLCQSSWTLRPTGRSWTSAPKAPARAAFQGDHCLPKWVARIILPRLRGGPWFGLWPAICGVRRFLSSLSTLIPSHNNSWSPVFPFLSRTHRRVHSDPPRFWATFSLSWVQPQWPNGQLESTASTREILATGTLVVGRPSSRGFCRVPERRGTGERRGALASLLYTSVTLKYQWFLLVNLF